nr:hypothetical protein 1 [Alphaproteobacteria bacterium]
MDKFNGYLTLLKTSAQFPRFSEQARAASNVLVAARMGSQSAYDSIVEFYVNQKSLTNWADPKSRPLILPAAAMLVATDKASKFKDESLFSEALYRVVVGGFPLAELFELDWSPYDNKGGIDNSFLKKFEPYFAPLLPRLIFKDDQNDGFDELVTGTESENCPANALSLIFFLGMGFLSGDRIDERQIFEPDTYLKPLLFYDMPKEKLEEVREKLKSTRLAFTQVRYSFDLRLSENSREYISENRDYFTNYVFKCFWQLSVIKEILETSLECAENSGYGGDRMVFGHMHLHFGLGYRPLELTYAGKHILGSLIALSEVLKQLLEIFEIDEDSPLNEEIEWVVDSEFDFSMFERVGVKMRRFHEDIDASFDIGQKLLAKYPILENYKCMYRDRLGAEPFWWKKKWEDS